MKIKTKSIVMFAALMLLMGCKNPDKNVVKIGVVGPMTGAGATTCEYWINGLNYAVEQINAMENGERYKLIMEDCQSDPAQAVSCYKRLEMQGVNYILAVGGQFSMAVAPLTKGKDVLFFTTADYNEAVLDQTDRGFRVYPSAETYGDTAANYLNRNFGFVKYSSLALNTVPCLEATKAFAKSVANNNGEMVFQETYDMGDNNFNNLVSKIADKEPQAVFLTGFGISPLAFANQIAANSKFDNIVLFGDVNIATKSFVEGIRNDKARMFYADTRFPEIVENEYYAKYNAHSNALVTSSYIIPFLIREARSNASAKSNQSQLEYLRCKTISTKIGDIQIDNRGNCKMEMQVYKLQ